MLKGGFHGVKTFPVRGKVCDAAAVMEMIREAEPGRSLVGTELFETRTHATENRSSPSDR